MKSYIIITDNTCDLEPSFYKEHNIPVIMLPYSIDDVVYGPDNDMAIKEFYDSIRNGKMPILWLPIRKHIQAPSKNT